MNEQQFHKLVYNTIYAVALVYYAGYFLRELLPSSLTNAVLAKPFVFVGEKLRLAARNSAIVFSLFYRELIAEFTPTKAMKTALNLAPSYVTMWRQRDRAFVRTSTKKLVDNRSAVCYDGNITNDQGF